MRPDTTCKNQGKKLMILGGARKSLPLIEYAVEKGYRTILCDYLPDNPGRLLADEYYSISAADKDLVLELAREKNIDGIVSYSSDLLAKTAAFVGNVLGLPSNPYGSVLTLTRKDLFRNFLKTNGFDCPRSYVFGSFAEAGAQIGDDMFPVMVKPVDSAGSAGVTKADSLSRLEEAFGKAMEISEENKVIVEEYIQMDHECMIGGDIFVLDGKITFYGLLNSHRGAEFSPFVPTGTSYPIFLCKKRTEEVHRTLQRAVDLLGMRLGGFNVELMYDSRGKLYIVEIAPRNGGNLIPELLKTATGADLTAALADASMGVEEIGFGYARPCRYYSTYVIHSETDGILRKIEYKGDIRDNIIREELYVRHGQKVSRFDNAKKALGIIFLKFRDQEEEVYKMRNMKKFIDIELEPDA